MINFDKITNVNTVTAQVSDMLRKGLFDDVLSREIIPPIVSRDASSVDDKKQLKFTQYHESPINAGNYIIEAKQTLGGAASGEFTSKTQHFRVDSERYQLPPQNKHFIFPPANDDAQNNAVLPHLMINQSTFPWERTSAITGSHQPKMNKPAWLVLLLLTEDEVKQIPLVRKKASEVQLEQNDDSPEEKQSDFNFLEINGKNKALIQSIFPRPKDIEYLAHTMITNNPALKKTNPKYQEEKSVLICPRFPTPGKNHTVHLISLEDVMWKLNKKDLINTNNEWTNEWNNISDTNKKYMVSLFEWSFFCKAQPMASETKGTATKNLQIGFRQILQKEVKIAPLRMQIGKDQPENSGVNNYLKRGYVPMPHYMRKGEKTVSWFHGPLVPPFKTWKGISVKNSTSADDYLFYDKKSKLLDVSYAAAWQLGRNLTLKNKAIAKKLYFLRKNSEQKAKQNLLDHPSFKAALPPNDNENEFNPIKAWIKELFELQHIPFNYLFPHPSMLPKESLRFVRLDFNWIIALLEGVLSVGVNSSAIFKNLKVGESPKVFNTVNFNALSKYKPLSGFVLRSKVVEDFPDLQIIGRQGDKIETTDDGMSVFINRKIGADIRLVLYQTEESGIIERDKLVKKIEIFTKPRGRHFGVYTDIKDNKTLYKKRLRAYDEQDIYHHGKFIAAKDPDDASRICTEFELDNTILNPQTKCLNVIKLVDKMDTVAKNYNQNKADRTELKLKIEALVKNSSANFAFHMIEGAPKVMLWANNL
jgi:hypothetical protein